MGNMTRLEVLEAIAKAAVQSALGKKPRLSKRQQAGRLTQELDDICAALKKEVEASRSSRRRRRKQP
jgi:hypothetical protein